AILLLYRNYFVGSGLLRTGLAGLTQVLVAGAIGALVAAAVTPVVVRSIGKSRWIVTLLATAAVSQPVLGAPYRMTTVLLAAAVIGFVGQGVKVCVDTIVQETIDDSFRGRVFSVYDTVFNVAFVGAAVLAAFTLPETGKSYLVLGLIAGGYALSAAGYALATATRSR
ncbi:MAG: MFS transporter, partial [Geodermatophilaceae bacterium]